MSHVVQPGTQSCAGAVLLRGSVSSDVSHVKGQEEVALSCTMEARISY